MATFLAVVQVIATVIAGFIGIAFTVTGSAPQQAAGFALALTVAFLPYTLWRLADASAAATRQREIQAAAADMARELRALREDMAKAAKAAAAAATVS